MKVVIIEDEEVVANDLEACIRLLIEEPLNIVQLESVNEAINYFRTSPEPDLIFSDIQLGDGLSFAIFVAVPVSVPVIFCTAYDAYALDAFKANGIDYILKPFTMETLERAIQRYNQLKKVFSTEQTPQFDALLQMMAGKDSNQTATSILVYDKDQITPVKLDNIALFYLENDVTHLVTFTGKSYYPNKSLDELERLTGVYFFRSNRQYLVSRKAIVNVSSFFSRTLSLNLNFPFPEKVTVSKGRVTQFLEWLTKS